MVIVTPQCAKKQKNVFSVIKVIWLAVNGIKFVIWNQLVGLSFVGGD